MTYDTVGTPGSDSEYFAEDYDSVHCRHGRFIGYPGGADFICGLCEDGATKLEHRMVARLEYTDAAESWWKGSNTLDTVYSTEGIHKWDKFIALWKKSAPEQLDLYWEFSVESYWVRPE